MSLLRTVIAIVLCSWIGAVLADEPTAPTRASAGVNGIELAYELRGQGEPLLLLHGFAACADYWAPLLPALAARHRLIIPDLRGHGRSTNPARRFSMRQSATDILSLLDHLGLDKVKAIGHSAGAMTLMHAATREPDRFEALVLIGASTHFTEQAREIMRGVPDGVPPPVLASFRDCAHRDGQAQVDELLVQFNGFKDSHDDMAFDAKTLAGIRARTLIVHGDRDEFFPVEIPVSMYTAIPGAALWVVPEGDHDPVFRHRREFEEIVTAFLGRAQAGTPQAATTP